jgi:hypothetical protein
MMGLMERIYPWLIAILCWAHQINLVVGDTFAIRGGITEDVNRALEVVKWFNNHGTALELLHQKRVLTFEYAWALILPVITRWTAYYLALTRLLKLKKPLQDPERIEACRLRRDKGGIAGESSSNSCISQRRSLLVSDR